ncbi:MAG: DUF4921 family protein [Candidatus Micrarchaeota archaeon]|nr:DUF4921 family protein [Candidatus Micrarchaeota archaeon]
MSDEKQNLTSEIRKDFLGRRVVLTSARGGRPSDHAPPERKPKSGDPSKCFFCPGNEHLTPPELDRIEKGGKWGIRCFPNKFPAFMESSKKAYGRHEVIVENPEHTKALSELSEENLVDYFTMIQRRMRAAAQDKRLKYSCVFKNEGQAAGASLEHSHTQLCAMEFVPPLIVKMGKKLTSLAKSPEALAKFEKQNKKRMCMENGLFFAFCPKAGRFKYETWIIPRFKVASFIEVDGAQLRSLASIFKPVLSAYDSASGFGPYNIIFHSAPHGEGEFLFHIQILPRLSTWAGFELATDIVMVSTRPHEAAGLLKSFIEKK